MRPRLSIFTLQAYLAVCVYGLVSGRYAITFIMGSYLFLFIFVPGVFIWLDLRKKKPK